MEIVMVASSRRTGYSVYPITYCPLLDMTRNG